MYEHDYSDKYKIELPPDRKYYLKIYYKNMQILWTLQEYTLLDMSYIIKQILNSTKDTTYNGFLKILLCKNKKDLNIIFRYLYNAYFERKNLPKLNIIEQSLKNFVSNDDEWHIFY